LIDYLEVSSEKNRDNRFTKDDVLSVSGEYGIVNQIEFQGRSFAGASVSNYGVVENGDVVYTKSPLKSNPYGIIKTNKGIPGIVSTLYAVYKPKEITDSKFVQIYFELDSRMNSYMHPLVNKGAKNDMKVSAENALKGMVSFPKKDEQEMISLYFSNLDHLITLHQRKCEQTKNLKKYMLQKMFPQNGAKVPEIRFNGFTHDWEQRKFGSLLEETRNKTIFEDEDTLLSCAIDGMYLNSELFSHFRGSSNIGYLKVKKNDLILSAQNLHLGNCNVNLRFEYGIISPAYKVYELVGCNPLFMQAWVKKDSTKDFFLKSSTEGASVCRKNIVWEELYKQELPVPSIEEQTKVGEYFYSLDHLITLHQRQTDFYKKISFYYISS
jgi:type I restriction enzyme S subunit